MGEKSKNRDAVDRLAKRLVDHGKATGKPVSASEASKVAAETARTEDRRREVDPPSEKAKARVDPKWQTVRGVYRIDPRSKFKDEG